MSEEEFQDFIQNILMENVEEWMVEGLIDVDYADVLEKGPIRIMTFNDAGLLTSDKGLVVQIGDSEFQVTIRRVS